ncbi:MAG: hypothetical protein V1781_07405 [Bacteroidota bacterium]
MKLIQEVIDELIRCEKRIIKMPSPWKLERGHYNTDFELQSTDEQYFFTAFGRYNAEFNENFSFGMVYYPKHEKGSYEIIRCNGPHGEHIQFQHHTHYHIHKATEQNIESGLREDSAIEITEAYTTFDDAFRFFVKYINVIQSDIDCTFPPTQGSLFDTL